MLIHLLVSVILSSSSSTNLFIAIFPTVQPRRPENLLISAIGSSWAYIQWESPSDSADLSSVFSHYEISVIDSRSGNGYVFPFSPVHINTSFLNVTGLQYETLYEFSVTAVSETCGILARSLSSNLAHWTTKHQGMLFLCRYAINFNI